MTMNDLSTLADFERLLARESTRRGDPVVNIDPQRRVDLKFTHTPGPWCVGSDDACDIGNPVAVMIDTNGNANSDVLVGCAGDHGHAPDPAANARLIVDAPGLLYAAVVLVQRLTALRDDARLAGMPCDHDGIQFALNQATRLIRRVGS